MSLSVGAPANTGGIYGSGIEKEATPAGQYFPSRPSLSLGGRGELRLRWLDVEPPIKSVASLMPTVAPVHRPGTRSTV